MDRDKKEHLEKLLQETQDWLLRLPTIDRPRDIYSEEMLDRYGPNLGNDQYVRVLRQVVDYVLDDD